MMKTILFGLLPQLNFKPRSFTRLIIAMFLTPLTSQCTDIKEMKRTQSFDSNWRFFGGEINSNPMSHEYFKATEQKAFNGLALVVVRSAGKTGEIKLSASLDGLKESGVTIKTKH